MDSRVKPKLVLIAGMSALAITVVVGFVILAPQGGRRRDARMAGDTLRVGDQFATLILVNRPWPWGSSRRRAPSLGAELLLHPVADPRRYETVAITDRDTDIDLSNNAKMLGYDGRRLWLFSHALFGVDVKTKQKIDFAELTRVNPEMAQLWLEESKYYKMTGDGSRLVVTVGDGRKFTLDPESLKVAPYTDETIPPPKDAEDSRRQWAEYNEKMSMFGIGPGKYFWNGEKISDEEWVGLLTEAEAQEAGTFRISPRSLSMDGKRRGLYRASLETTLDRGQKTTRLLKMEQIGKDTYLDAGMLREVSSARALRLTNPPGYVVMHRFRLGDQGTLMLTRIDMQGKKLWEFDTGILKVDHILPGGEFLGLVSLPAKIHSVNLATGTMIEQAIQP